MSRAGSLALTAVIVVVSVAGGLFLLERALPALSQELDLADRFGKWETLIRGTPEADVLRGGPENEIILDSYIPDKARDRLYGGAGADVLDAVSDPPLEDFVRCGAGEDEAQVDPEDDVGGDCERVDTIDLSRGSQPPKGEPKYVLAPGERVNTEVQVIDLRN